MICYESKQLGEAAAVPSNCVVALCASHERLNSRRQALGGTSIRHRHDSTTPSVAKEGDRSLTRVLLMPGDRR